MGLPGFTLHRREDTMTTPETALPSVSSLLKLARCEVTPDNDDEPQPANTPAPNPTASKKRPAVVSITLPAPLTAEIIKRASEELPQGAQVALYSCISAYQVQNVIVFITVCPRRTAQKTRILWWENVVDTRKHTLATESCTKRANMQCKQ